MSHYTYPGGYLEAQHSRDNEIDALEQKLARADARIAELERECSQWRDELRIYRETENKRIAELETDLELARRDVERYRWLRDESGNDHHTPWCAVGYSDPTWLTGEHLDAAIDAARAGNGGVA